MSKRSKAWEKFKNDVMGDCDDVCGEIFRSGYHYAKKNPNTVYDEIMDDVTESFIAGAEAGLEDIKAAEAKDCSGKVVTIDGKKYKLQSI
jgi:hypothetical protein